MNILFATLTCALITVTTTFEIDRMYLKGKGNNEQHKPYSYTSSVDNELSYIAAIIHQYSTWHRCTGVLITHVHVLVVPQCLHDDESEGTINIKLFRVYLGTFDYSKRSVEQCRIHSLDVNFNFFIDDHPIKNISNDIGVALIERKSFMKLKLREASLPHSPIVTTDEYDVVGFRAPRYPESHEIYTGIFDIAKISGKSACKKSLERVFEFGEKQICTQKDCKADILIVPQLGDILVKGNVVMGLQTFSSNVAGKHYIVYTDVYEHLAYIKEAIQRLKEPFELENIVIYP